MNKIIIITIAILLLMIWLYLLKSNKDKIDNTKENIPNIDARFTSEYTTGFTIFNSSKDSKNEVSTINDNKRQNILNQENVLAKADKMNVANLKLFT